jgi:hypothetical protein
MTHAHDNPASVKLTDNPASDKQSGWATWRHLDDGYGVFVNGHPYQEYEREVEAATFARGWNQCKRYIDGQANAR